MEVHYQSTFFKRDSLREAAQTYLRWLPKDVNTLISTGSSGCAIATAMVTISNRTLRHVFIRKQYEMKAHGNRFVGFDYGMQEYAKCAIVDDFIHTGRTITKLMKYLPERELCVDTVIVGHNSGFNEESLIKKLERRYKLQIIIV